jgi:iron complex transport system permease protein
MTRAPNRAAAFVVAAVPLALLAAVMVGSVPIAPQKLALALAGGGDPIDRQILWDLRLPRALAAFACGGLLALSGALLQVLLRNPLADPFLLGISGGSATGTLLAMLAGASTGVLRIASFTGAAVPILAVFVAARARGEWNPYRLLLVGVALSSGFGALIALILSVAPAGELPGMLFWLLGDLSAAGEPWLAGAVLIAALAAVQAQSRPLDVLALGEAQAYTLGVNVARVRGIALAAACLAAAGAVLLGGSIGFVGLVIPHLLRLSGVHEHRSLLPLSVCLGGSFLATADALARSAAAPAELPVGAVTALIGVPVLLALIARSRA